MNRRRRRFLALVPAAVVTACRRKGTELAEVVNMADAQFTPQLVRGFHPIEQGSWRWTESKFAVALRPPRRTGAEGALLRFKYSLPEASLAKLKEITITAMVDGVPLQPEKCSQTGMMEMRREVPGDILRGREDVRVEFTVTPFLPPSETDRRELGVIAHEIGLVRKGSR